MGILEGKTFTARKEMHEFYTESTGLLLFVSARKSILLDMGVFSGISFIKWH